MISRLKEFLKKYQIIRLIQRSWIAKTTGYPNWSKIIKKDKGDWEKILTSSKEGPRILIATSVGSHLSGIKLESLLGVALTLRGAEIHVLLCDSALPACLACDVTWYP